MTEPTRAFFAGQRVTARCADEIIAATVAFASSNGYALALEFDGIFARCVNVLPVLWDDEFGAYRALVDATPVIIEPLYPSQMRCQ